MFYKDKKVLVTGGTGLVGTAFVKELLKQGAIVRVPLHKRPFNIIRTGEGSLETCPVDLINLEDCLKVTKNIDYVVHAAGAISAAAVTVSNPMDAIATNLILTLNVIQAAWQQGVKGFLILSSQSVYPQTDAPNRENEAGSIASAYFGYGDMRWYLEGLGKFVASRSDMKVAIVRPSAAYGSWDNFDPVTSHVIPGLIRKAMEKQDPYEVWGSGEETRDFIHVSDIARGGVLALERHATCDPINLATDRAIKIKEIVNIILGIVNHNPEIVFDSDKPTTIPYRMLDTNKAKKLLNFRAEMSLEEGLRDTINWYKEMK